MKVAILAIPAADIDASTITVEGTVRNIRDFMGVLNNDEIISDGSTFTRVIDAPFDVQAATLDGTVAATVVNIDTSYEPELKNFSPAGNVTRWIKGKSYLINNANCLAVPMVPNIKKTVAVLNTGNDSAVHCASRFLYVALEGGVPLNNVTPNAITFDVDYEAIKRNAARKAEKKAAEAMSYGSASNH